MLLLLGPRDLRSQKAPRMVRAKRGRLPAGSAAISDPGMPSAIEA